MTRKFKVGDHVAWNSEAGHVTGRIINVHTEDVDYKGYTHHASEDDPQASLGRLAYMDAFTEQLMDSAPGELVIAIP